jgi:exodeoxyribonuclease III
MNLVRRVLLFLGTALLSTVATGGSERKLTLLSMNMWGAGANDGKTIAQTVAVMRASKADIIAAQETVPEPDPCTADVCKASNNSRAKQIAAALGFYYYEFRRNTENHWADAVFSRYPIGKPTPNGVGIEINFNGAKIVAYSMNLDDGPYQPYQLLNIEYGNAPFLKTAKQAIQSAQETRGEALRLLIADIKAESDAMAQFVMGDFNEPSFRDWTTRAAAIGRHPLAVGWPTTRGLEDQGFVDTFRAVFPDEIAKPGMTWTPRTKPSDKDDHHDRIDFVFARAKGLRVLSVGIVGEKKPEADLVVRPWPSDHRASMAVVSF